MKKIMFNDRYGLTQAVIRGHKTQTRRVIPDRVFQDCRSIAFLETGLTKECEHRTMELLLEKSKYKLGEEVAIAQCYYDVFHTETHLVDDISATGVFNKMFVKAEYMPYKIRITNIRVEHLQEIDEDDCYKEGIYVSAPLFPSIRHHKFIAYSPDATNNVNRKKAWFTTPMKAYQTLIESICGKETWSENPLVFVYDFEII